MNHLLWLGLVLLGGGWLFVLPVYQRPDPLWAGAVLLAGTLSISLACGRATGARRSLWVGPALLLITALAHLWVDPLAWLLGSRVHRLDGLAPLVQAALTLVGLDVHLEGGVLHVVGAAQLLPFTVNAEKLALLPAAWIGVSVGAACLVLRRERPLRTLALAALAVGAYLLLRYVVLVVLFLEHPDPRNAEASHSTSLAWFQSPRWQLGSLLPLALLLASLLPWRRGELVRRTAPGGPAWRGLALAAAGAAALVVAIQYQDPGRPKQGRVLFDEVHSSAWESAVRPLDTEWYGRDSVYNYASLVDFLGQTYDVQLNVDAPYDDALLAGHDVLIVKTTTTPFSADELDAIERFVAEGGGLFLIGDHTDLLGMSTHMNALAGRFGLRFRLDAANRLDDGHLHSYRPHPLFVHPATAHLSELEFMTSCTIEAPLGAESVMIGSNVFSDPLDYSAPSFFGNVIADTEDDFGLHVLAAATQHGQGRVLAFGDSTVFSNFAVMYGERPEFLLGAMEYLNRSNDGGRLWNRLWLGAGLVLLGLAAGALRGRGALTWGLALSAALGLGTLAGAALTSWHVRAHYPPPAPRAPATTLLFPRDWGDYHLPAALGHLHVPRQECFDTFYVWTQRLGYTPRTLDWDEGLPLADAVVLLNPVHEPDRAELQQLVEFVEGGGRLLVLDSLWNDDSRANEFLAPFGLRLAGATHEGSNVYAGAEWLAQADEGQLDFGGLRARPLDGTVLLPASTVVGGMPLIRTADERVLAASAEVGEGRVIAFVDSVSFSRLALGEQVESVSADDPRRAAFELEYRLLRDYLMADDTPTGDEAPGAGSVGDGSAAVAALAGAHEQHDHDGHH